MSVEEIKVPQVSIPPRDILLKDRGQSIFLYPQAMVVVSSGDWNVPKDDDESIREKCLFDNTYAFSKDGNWPLEMYFHNKSRCFILDIATTKVAFGNEGEHPSESRKRCKDGFDKIIKWKYNI